MNEEMEKGAEPETAESFVEETLSPNADEMPVLLESVQQDVEHPFLTTDFADYTVTEGLLLLCLLLSVIFLCAKMLKEGFSWL